MKNLELRRRTEMNRRDKRKLMVKCGEIFYGVA